ncbi:MAG: hypothetical protein ACKV1O_27325 [Saprospiraceae bacterium]
MFSCKDEKFNFREIIEGGYKYIDKTAYVHQGKPVVGVGVNFSSQSKNIEAWSVEEMA